MMTCLSGTLTRKERNSMGSQSLNITALLSYSTSAELNCSLTIWMRRERRSTSKVPEMVKLCSHVARSRYTVGNDGMLSDSTK